MNRNSNLREVIKPYLGGAELNNSPTMESDRLIIDFTGKGLDQEAKFKEAFEIVRERVKPYVKRKDWWLFEHQAKEILQEIGANKLANVIAIAETSDTFAPALVSSKNCFSNKLVIFSSDSISLLGVLHSRIHEYWCRMTSCTLKDDLTYVPSACFETFPAPEKWQEDEQLRELASDFSSHRRSALRNLDIGMTKLYSLVSNPECSIDCVAKFRIKLDAIDKHLLHLYGFTDLYPEFSFYETEHLESDEAHIKWRYGWSPAAIDLLLAKLIEINNDLAKEAEALHCKTSKVKSTKASASFEQGDLF